MRIPETKAAIILPFSANYVGRHHAIHEEIAIRQAVQFPNRKGNNMRTSLFAANCTDERNSERV